MVVTVVAVAVVAVVALRKKRGRSQRVIKILSAACNEISVTETNIYH